MSVAGTLCANFPPTLDAPTVIAGEKPVPYLSKRAAEGVEQVLYLCPECKKAGTIRSKGITITCTHCASSASLDPYDKLHTTQGTHHYDDIAAWHAWEKKYIGMPESSSLAFPPDKGVLLQTGDEKKLITLEKQFTLQMEREGMSISSKSGKNLFFRLPISNDDHHAKNTVELYHDTHSTESDFKRGCISSTWSVSANERVLRETKHELELFYHTRHHLISRCAAVCWRSRIRFLSTDPNPASIISGILLLVFYNSWHRFGGQECFLGRDRLSP